MNRPLTVLALAAVMLAGCGGEAPAKPPDGLEVADLTIDSTAVDKDMKVKVVVPEADAEGRPLLVFLHGRGGNESSSLRKPMFDALKALGTRAPIVAFPAGDDHSYWHNRKSGAYGRYVMKEVIPQVARRFGADRRRVAIGGISMGGFGAFDLARAHPKRFCAVGGHSPAVWRSGGETAPGAFDDAADFARHDVIAGAGRFAGQTRVARRRRRRPVPPRRSGVHRRRARRRRSPDREDVARRPRQQVLGPPLAGLPALLRQGAERC